MRVRLIVRLLRTLYLYFPRITTSFAKTETRMGEVSSWPSRTLLLSPNSVSLIPTVRSCGQPSILQMLNPSILPATTEHQMLVPASLEDLNVSLSSLFSKHPCQVPNLAIGGDFNLGDIDWETWTPTIQRTRSIHDKFLQLLMEHSLVQLNRHITRPASKKCLDYAVTSNQNLVSNIEVFPGVSDHLIVAFNIDMKPHHSVKPQRKIFVFKKANNDLLKEDVSRFSAEFLSSNPQENSVNENWLTIKQTLTALMHGHVPSKLSRTRHHLPWIDFTLKLKRQMHRQDRMFSKARKRAISH